MGGRAMVRGGGVAVLWAIVTMWWAVGACGEATGAGTIHVDGTRGDDAASGEAGAPLRTLGGAIERLGEPLEGETTILLAAGRHAAAGGSGAVGGGLALDRRMRDGARVRIAGDGKAALDWAAGGEAMVKVVEGNWVLEGVQIGMRGAGQRRGVSVEKGGRVELRDVRIRTGSFSDAGVWAARGGEAVLSGRIEINEDLHGERGKEETFAGIRAEHGGVVRFAEREGASLSMGNGSMSAAYYGVIELGCAWARVTSWGEQSNCVAVNNSGRVDLHGTSTTLCAMNAGNTPVGLEHDGHVLAEGARLTIRGRGNPNAIHLQKASSFFCNDVTILGEVRGGLMASSGSVLLAGIEGNLAGARATTGATVIIEKCTGKVTGEVTADRAGRVVMPDGKVVAEAQGGAGTPLDVDALPPLLRAAAKGEGAAMAARLAAGDDVNERGPGGRSALHWAAAGGHAGAVEALLRAGAQRELRDDAGRTAGELAEAAGHSVAAGVLK